MLPVVNLGGGQVDAIVLFSEHFCRFQMFHNTKLRKERRTQLNVLSVIWIRAGKTSSFWPVQKVSKKWWEMKSKVSNSGGKKQEIRRKVFTYEKFGWKEEARDWINVEMLMQPETLEIPPGWGQKAAEKKGMNTLEMMMEIYRNRLWVGGWAISLKHRLGVEWEKGHVNL